MNEKHIWQRIAKYTWAENVSDRFYITPVYTIFIDFPSFLSFSIEHMYLLH